MRFAQSESIPLRDFKVQRDAQHTAMRMAIQYLKPKDRHGELRAWVQVPDQVRWIRKRFMEVTGGDKEGFRVFGRYSKREINEARYVEFVVSVPSLEQPEKPARLNMYRKIICESCTCPDLQVVPNPYIVKRPGFEGYRMFVYAGNGIHLVSRELWEMIGPELAPWVQLGSVVFEDRPGEVTDQFIWILPKETIGRYTNSFVVDSCKACGQPLEVRGRTVTDTMLSTKVVTQISSHAPIVLIGNWYGELMPDFYGRRLTDIPPCVYWEVVISGELHERLSKLRIRRFVPAKSILYSLADVKQLDLGPFEELRS